MRNHRVCFFCAVLAACPVFAAVSSNAPNSLHVGEVQALLDHAPQVLSPAECNALTGMGPQLGTFSPSAEPAFVELTGLLGPRGGLPSYGNTTYNNRSWGYRAMAPENVVLLGQTRGEEVMETFYTSPLVLELAGTGTEAQFAPHPYTFDTGVVAEFDIDGDGFQELTEWVSPSLGILLTIPWGQPVLSVSASNMVGMAGGYRNGFEHLADFDTDHDGVVGGPELDALTAWKDLDGDAVPEEGELFQLAALGIGGLRLTHTGVRGSFLWLDQSEGAMWDWFPTCAVTRPAGGTEWQPMSLSGTLATPTQAQATGTVTPVRGGVTDSLGWSALSSMGFNPPESLLVGLSPDGGIVLLVDYPATAPRHGRVWILKKGDPDWSVYRFDVPEEGLDQVRFDAPGQNVLLVGKGGTRYYTISALDSPNPTLSRVNWTIPGKGFRGAWGTPFVQVHNMGEPTVPAEYCLVGYFHTNGMPDCDAVARLTIDSAAGLASLVAAGNVYSLLGHRLDPTSYNIPYAFTMFSPQLAAVAAHRTDGSISLSLLQEGPSGWAPSDVVKGPASGFDGLLPCATGGADGLPRLTYVGPGADGALGLHQCRVGPVVPDWTGSLPLQRTVTCLEVADFGRQAVWGEFDWNTQTAVFRVWQPGAAAPSFIRPVSEPCGALRAASEAPVFAIQSASALSVIRIPAGADLTPPVITLVGPPSVTVECGEAFPDAGAIAYDDVDGDLTGFIVVYNPVNTSEPGEYTITYNVSDHSGNAAEEVARTVVVADTRPPVFVIPPADKTSAVDGSCQAQMPDCTTDVVAVDACGGFPAASRSEASGASAIMGQLMLSQTPAPGTLLPKGVYDVYVTATDPAGNFAKGKVKWFADDMIPPALFCADKTVEAGPGCLGTVPDFTADCVADDDCDAVLSLSQSPAAGDLLGLGTHPIIVTATDGSGNTATCTALLDVVDTTSPTVTCRLPQTVEAGAGCMGVVPTFMKDPMTDDCPFMVVQIPYEGTMLGLGNYPVTVTGTDSSGNTATCTSLLTIEDTTAPSLNCGNKTVAAGPLCKGAVPDFAAVTDACEVTVIQTPAVGEMLGLGTYPVTVTATDGSGNTASCTVALTVADLTPPVIIACAGDQTVPADASCQALVPDFTMNFVAMDDCDADLAVTQSPEAGTVVGMEKTPITLTVTDDAGNAASCTAFLNVSAGLCMVTVPNVIGLQQVTATNSLRAAGLTLGAVAAQCSNTVPVGVVMSQSPSNPSRVPWLTAVNLVVSSGPCRARDNGNCTAALPADCPYVTEDGTMNIVDGLAPGDQLQSSARIGSFFDIFLEAGGSLGGERETFKAAVALDMQGTGTLAGFHRNIGITPTLCEVHTAPRLNGEAVQTFASVLHQLQCQITGDPDFDLLRITAGTGFGLPSPGHTTISRLPDGQWMVDSFFDITYRIDFVGNPGGPLVGRSGSTTGTVRVRQGTPIYVGETCTTSSGPGGYGVLPASCPFVPESGTMDIVDGLPPGTQLNSTGRIDSFFDIFTEAGGSLGGERETFGASLHLDMKGTGTLGTYARTFVLPHVLEVHTSPRTPGLEEEELVTDLFQLQGQITGDPDFDLLRVTAGTNFGMPCPGQSTLWLLHPRMGDVDLYCVDSFFDITYRIDFVGAPGGPLAGMSGSTTATIRMHQGTPAPVLPPVCVEPDNGAGTADLPAACPFTSPSGTMNVVDGLPPGTELHSEARIDSFFDVFTEPGGGLGGERETFDASLHFDMKGTGTLSSFTRTITVPQTLEVHTAPRTPGSPVQSFDADMFWFTGQIIGDPDFDLLRVTAGDYFGMPGPGHITLTRQPGGTFSVDSFFDITYRIDFIGAPGGPLAGMSGSTTGTIRIQQGAGACPAPPGGDTTAPVITLTGESPVTVECGTTYADAGATALDDFDGVLTSSIVTANPVNPSVVGTYTVTYNVSDSGGNHAVQVTRTVSVTDTTPPVVTLNGSATVTIECGGGYTELGATAVDACAGGLPVTTSYADITVGIIVPASVVGSTTDDYWVIYKATDPSGNTGIATRTVHVVDTTPPLVTLNGAVEMTVECGAVYVDPGATAWDVCADNLTGSIATTGTVNTAATGTYTLHYNVNDGNGNSAGVTRIVTVADMGSAGALQWTWTKGASTSDQVGVYGSPGAPDPDNTPGGRFRGATWTDASGKFWLFGGYGKDGAGNTGWLNDLWKYDPDTGDWTWMKGTVTVNQPAVYGTRLVSDPANTPGARHDMVSWTDASGNLWLFGGYDSSGCLNDLWKYDPATGDWTWMKGASTNYQYGTYGTPGSPDPANTPGARSGAVSWTDASGNLWLFGGHGCDSGSGVSHLNDLWKYDPAAGNWTWINGASTCNARGIYGTLGTPDPANMPGARANGVCWGDSLGNAWIFGGSGYDGAGNWGALNDLWQYDASTDNWTWMKGASTCGQAGTYGTLGTAGTANTPGGRWNPVSWVDSHGKLWLFGGWNGGSDWCSMNDLWQYDPATGNWTWMKGSSVGYQPGIYGTLGTPSPDNTPGARQSSAAWPDRSGNLWLLGGLGSAGAFNDLWRINVSSGADTVAPVIALLGADPVIVECGATYSDAGAAASDGCSGDLTDRIAVTNPVLTSVPGTYTVRYNVADHSGNAAVEATRTVTVEDATPPVIVLNGADAATVECGGTYTDAGATATDACAGDVTASIAADNPVNTAVPGVYTVRYNLSCWPCMGDFDLNDLSTRMVTVVDTASPVITLNGPATVTAECGSTYTDPGATAIDACAGSVPVTPSPLGDGNPDFKLAIDNYMIIYTASDSVNGAVEVTRTVIGVDTTPPVITLNGPATVTVECGGTYTDPGATVTDNCATGLVTAGKGHRGGVGSMPGGPEVYTITYNVSDGNGNNAAEVTRTVYEEDTTPPVITLSGAAEVTVECGGTYTDPGATATDACAGDLTLSIAVDSAPHPSPCPNDYIIRYNVTDPSGNAAPEVTRTVHVVDTVPPEPPVISGVTPTNNRRPTWIWTSGGGGGSGRYEWDFDYSGTWTETYATSYTPDGDLLPGVHRLAVREYDASGNVSLDSFFDIFIEISIPDPPVVTGPPVTNSLRPTWTWVPGSPDCVRYEWDLDYSGTWTETTSQSFTPDGDLVPGMHRLTVRAYDAAGNVSADSFFDIFIEITLPVITACPTGRTLGVDNDCDSVVPDLTHEVVATDDTTPSGELLITQDPAAGETVTGPGAHTVTVTVRDEANNAATCDVTLTLTSFDETGTIPAVVPWTTNGTVSAMAVDRDTLYIGGSFTWAGAVGGSGSGWSNLAAVDIATGAVRNWKPAPTGAVTSLALSADGTTLYAGGGNFVDEVAVSGATATQILAGVINVNAMAATATDLYFTNGDAVGVYDLAGGAYLGPWSTNPPLAGTVHSLALSGTTLYAGEDFLIEAVDLGTLEAASFSTSDGVVSALAVSCGTVFAGGSFSNIGGQPRDGLASLDAADGTAKLIWSPRSNAAVTSLAVSGDALHVGGSFTAIDSLPFPGLAKFAALAPVTVTVNQAAGQIDPAPYPTPTVPIQFSVAFSEAVTGFTTGDVTWSGTAMGVSANVTGTGANYTIRVTASSVGTLIPSIAAGRCLGAAGNYNAASTGTDGSVTVSNAPKTISVTAPAPGEYWARGTTHDIRWNASLMTGNIEIRLYDYNGTASTNPNYGTSVTLASGIPVISGAWTWTVPTGQANGSKYKVRAGSSQASAYSEYFEVGPDTPFVRVTSQNSGMPVFAPGDAVTVTWMSYRVTGNVQLMLYDYQNSDTSPTYSTKLSGIPVTNGTASWTIPTGHTLGGMYKFRVGQTAPVVISDYNDVFCAIGAGTPSVLMTSPNGGEMWARGSTHSVTFTTNCIADKVVLQVWNYTTGVGTTITPVTGGVQGVKPARDGSNTFSWTIPPGFATGVKYKMRVVTRSGALSDFSNSYFTVN